MNGGIVTIATRPLLTQAKPPSASGYQPFAQPARDLRADHMRVPMRR